MKKSHILFSLVLGIVLAAPVATCWGAPIGTSNMGKDYVLAGSSLYRWNFGVFGADESHAVTIKSSDLPVSLESQKLMVYLGYDLIDWLTVYGTLGRSESKPEGDIWSSGNSQMEWGGGLRFNILDHIVPDPTLFEDKIRLIAGAQYTFAQADQDLYPWKWEELLAYLTLSIVNDVEGNPLYLPSGIAVYGGPMFSFLRSNDLKQKSDDRFGFNLGVEVFFTQSVSFDLGMQQFDKTGYTGGLHVRF